MSARRRGVGGGAGGAGGVVRDGCLERALLLEPISAPGRSL